MLINSKDLAAPKAYIRGTLHKGYVQELAEILSTHPAHNKGPAVQGEEWPFPEILVRKIEGEKPYELIDGTHRVAGALESHWQMIPAKVIQADDAQAYILQLAENLKHGLRPSQDVQRKVVKTLRAVHKLVQTEIAKRTGLSQPTVSRYLKTSESKPSPKKGKTRKPGQAPAPKWTSGGFFDRLHSLFGEFNQHTDTIITALRHHKGKVPDNFAALIAAWHGGVKI